MPPLVSILTLCYNHAPYLHDYFEGILSQSYRNLELIITDDSSSDSTWEIIRHHQPVLERSFPRVVCQRTDSNLGFFGALRHARPHVTGDLFCLLDGDDFYYPSKIAKNVAFLARNPDVGLVHSDVDFLYVDSGRIERSYWKKAVWTGWAGPPRHRPLERLVQGDYVTTCTMCCRTRLLNEYVDWDRYQAAGYRMADHPMVLDLAAHTDFGYIDEALACYRQLPNSTCRSTDPARQLEFYLSHLQVSLDYIDRYDLPRWITEKLLRRRASLMFDYGYLLGREEICWEGYSWLCAHFPDTYATLRNRLRALSSRYGLLHLLSRGLRRLRSLGRRPRVATAHE